ncbi:PDZ domain-containing protein [Arcanobacterium phocae]|uniref:YlbL family protein n=1 Tax=Arcanobacterium phocae TaxID=131112 RepID=UPI001C9D9E5D
MSRRAKSPAVPAVIFGLFAVGAIVMPSSFIVMGPGPANDVTALYDGQRMVEVSGQTTYPSDTHLFMTTVSAYGNPDYGASGGIVARALFDPGSRVLPVRALYAPQETNDDVSSRGKQMMTSSQDTAAAVAMERAGLDVKMTLTISGSTNKNADVEEGDIIKAVRTAGMDKPEVIASFSQLSKILATVEPGSDITVTVERNGKNLDKHVTTVARPPEFDGAVRPGSMMGVFISVTDVSLPAQAHYLVDGIGGPSAGNIFSVAIYDQLTPGSLGADHRIAGTGALAWDGSIQPIGGIAQKLVGAHDAGAHDFLAPAANCAETRGHIPEGMRVWAVRTIDDSIAAVKAIGEQDTSDLTPCSAVKAPVMDLAK